MGFGFCISDRFPGDAAVAGRHATLLVGLGIKGEHGGMGPVTRLVTGLERFLSGFGSVVCKTPP